MKSHSITLHNYCCLYLVPSGPPPDIEQMKAELVPQQMEMSSSGEADLNNEDTVAFSDDPNYLCQLKCNICGGLVKKLGPHVIKCHSVSEDEYRILYPDQLFFQKTYHR